MPYPKAVLFDNDGLLLDTESVWTRAEQQLFGRRGLEFTIDHKRSLVGSSQEAAGLKLGRFLAEVGDEEAIMEELNVLVLAELERGVDEMPGAGDLVRVLRQA
ncbi:MAG: HAD family phosphatase [Solirubrobacterales bacterium]|nr:HAD family phosphatase [Solirubrobacterales bacterium]